jgi:hypothetical protein
MPPNPDRSEQAFRLANEAESWEASIVASAPRGPFCAALRRRIEWILSSAHRAEFRRGLKDARSLIRKMHRLPKGAALEGKTYEESVLARVLAIPDPFERTRRLNSEFFIWLMMRRDMKLGTRLGRSLADSGTNSDLTSSTGTWWN